MRRSFDEVTERLGDTGRALSMMRLISDPPGLYASHLHKQTQWSKAITEALMARLTTTPRGEKCRLRAGALAAAGVLRLEYARLEWVACGGKRSVTDLLVLAMDAVSPLARR
ncbi:hypothetical protein AB0L67_28945 [Streptomyces flaveolus]